LTKYNKKKFYCSGAFSLFELVIVIAIMAVIAAIAIPRMSRGSRGADEAALKGDLAVLRKAIEVFAAEHGNTYPSVSNIVNQLTQYTDVLGDAQASRDQIHIYGPYVAKIPPLPVGRRKGGTDIAAEDGENVGWIYNENTGHIRANMGTEAELSGAEQVYLNL
jgi:prepilin-type N-terminal cleavage/methylation domain-containing protein